MPTRCIAAACGKTTKDGVSLHLFPTDPNVRRIWTTKVESTRAKWDGPTQYSALCSDHFEPTCFEAGMYGSVGMTIKKMLKKDAIPTKFPTSSKGKDPPKPANDPDPPGASDKREQIRLVVKLTAVNQYITCHLCWGYLVNATTIIECLHTFCKSCLVQFLYTSKRCPTCDILIHETNPYSCIRFDRTKQDILNKLLPYVALDEAENEKIFYKSRGITVPEKDESQAVVPATSSRSPDAKPLKQLPTISHLSDTHMSILLEFIGACDNFKRDGQIPKKFVRVSQDVSIRHIQRFLAKKLELDYRFEVDIVCGMDIIEPNLTLRTLSKQVPTDQFQNGLLLLNYSLVDADIPEVYDIP